MSLPIVIIFERHWDTIPKTIVKELLPDLSKKGYQTLCFEAPQNLSSSEIIERYKAGLELESDIQQEAEKLIKPFSVEQKLSDMSFRNLALLMKLYVSHKKYIDVAEKIKQLPSSYILKEIFDEALRLSISIKGIDIDSEEFDEMVSIDLSKRISNIKINEHRRLTTLFQNLLKIRSQQEEGIVFICGAFHAHGLLSEFKKHNLQDKVLYYFPHSSSRYDNNIDDINTLAMNDTLINHTYLLSQEEIRPFRERMINEIAGKIEYKTEIFGGNSHSQFLSLCFKTHCRAFLRPGYHVDILVDANDTCDIEGIRRCVSQVGAQTHMISLNERRHLVISNVNSRDIADRIRRISP